MGQFYQATIGKGISAELEQFTGFAPACRRLESNAQKLAVAVIPGSATPGGLPVLEDRECIYLQVQQPKKKPKTRLRLMMI